MRGCAQRRKGEMVLEKKVRPTAGGKYLIPNRPQRKIVTATLGSTALLTARPTDVLAMFFQIATDLTRRRCCGVMLVANVNARGETMEFYWRWRFETV